MYDSTYVRNLGQADLETESRLEVTRGEGGIVLLSGDRASAWADGQALRIECGDGTAL